MKSECRSSKGPIGPTVETRPKPRFLGSDFVIRISFGFRHSSFVIPTRYSDFVIRVFTTAHRSTRFFVSEFHNPTCCAIALPKAARHPGPAVRWPRGCFGPASHPAEIESQAHFSANRSVQESGNSRSRKPRFEGPCRTPTPPPLDHAPKTPARP